MLKLLQCLVVGLALAGNAWGQAASRVVLEANAPISPETIAVLEKRVSAVGFRNTTIQSPNAEPSRVHVQVSGANAAELDRLVATLTRPGVLSINMVDQAATMNLPAKPETYPERVAANGRIALPDDTRGGDLLVIFEDGIVLGADIADARQIFDRDRPAVAFDLHAKAAQRFGRATAQNVGGQFAIVLDERIIAAPYIVAPIMGGKGTINGSFTVEEARQIAALLSSGALPVKLKVVERTVEN